MMRRKVVFLPEEKTVEVSPGTSLLRAAALAGIEIKSSCGGKGSCGNCLVRVEEGKPEIKSTGKLSREEREKGYLLSCQAFVGDEDLQVLVPHSSRLEEHRVLYDRAGEEVEDWKELFDNYTLSPLCSQFKLVLEPPSLSDNISDLCRLRLALRKEMQEKLPETEININRSALKNLAEELRAGEWAATVALAHFDSYTEIITVKAGNEDSPLYGLAVDIGTTTVAAYLVDLVKKEIVAKHGHYNKQARYGDDIISRIIYATEEEKGLEELQKAIVATINEIIRKMIDEKRITEADILQVVVAGNTTMIHLFLGITPKHIRLQPYIPTVSNVPPVKAVELGLRVNPEAWVNSFPQVASYLGGDIVSGILFSGIYREGDIVLFVDIGTNGEIVLGNKDWMIGCACSAGPAFEGGGITFGMRAMRGAIERVFIDPATLECQVATIGNAKPLGICGSGLIDLLSSLKETGIIDRSGSFQGDLKSPRLRHGNEGWEYVVAWARDAGGGEDIVITEGDVKNLIRAKGAVYAGIRSLLRTLELEESVISRVIIAGGFGNYLHIRDAIRIGLLPDMDVSKFHFIGNSSLKGACLALLSRDAYKKAEEIGKMITYLELSVGTTFMDEYVSALFLPHTDLSLFPSAQKEEEASGGKKEM